MARPAGDSIKVAWTGTGTGTMSLGAAVAGFQAFPAAMDGQPVSYAIENDAGTERENGIGTYTAAGTTLTRDLVTFSTAGAPTKQSFSAGTKHVRVVPLAHDLVPNHATANPTATDDITAGYIAGRSRWLNTTTKRLFECVDHQASAALWAVLPSQSQVAVIEALDVDDGGTFDPAAVDLSNNKEYDPITQTIDWEFTLSGATPVPGAWISVEVTGNGDPITYVADFAAIDGSSLTSAPYSGFTGARRLMIQWSATQAKALVALSGVSGGGTWGSITGTLSAQTDLQAALNVKLQASNIAAGAITPAPGALNLGGGVDGQVLTKQADGSIALEAVPGGTGGHTIEDEGSALPTRASLNFVGGGVTASDTGGKTQILIPSGVATTLDTRIVNVKDFGATGTGASGTDDTTALNAAHAAANALATGSNNQIVLWYPTATDLYRATAALTPVDRVVNVWMDQGIIFTGTPAALDLLVLGSTGGFTENRRHKLHVRSNTNGAATAGFRGVVLLNQQVSDIYVPRASGFEIGVALLGQGPAGVSTTLATHSCSLYMEHIVSNRIGLDMGGRSLNAWCNGQRIFGGYYRAGALVSTALERIGIRFLNSTAVGDEAISGNGNCVYGGGFEPGGAGGARICIQSNVGPNSINAIGGRFESYDYVYQYTAGASTTHVPVVIPDYISDPIAPSLPAGQDILYWPLNDRRLPLVMGDHVIKSARSFYAEITDGLPHTLDKDVAPAGCTIANTGTTATWTLPSRVASASTSADSVQVLVHNFHASDAITFAASGPTLVGVTTLPAGESATIEWVRKTTGTERVIVRATA